MTYSGRSCRVMGISNRTPDSFYDGGRTELEAALAHALSMVEEGADVIDVGGVKAGPGAEVSEQEEADRVLPLIEAIRARSDVTLSVETAFPDVARAALAAGAAIVNDVSGLRDPELAAVCAEAGARLVLMHNGSQIRGRPRNPRYADIVEEVVETWESLAAVATERGMARANLIADAGLDFGKTTFHSLELMRRLPEQVATGFPLLVAPSRKDVVGETLGLPPADRLEGTLALVALCALHGAAIVRVHDVAAAARVIAMIEAVHGRRPPQAPVRGLWE